MQNVITHETTHDATHDVSIAAALETATQATAVLDVPAPSVAEMVEPAVDAAPGTTPAVPETLEQPLAYTHQDLLDARTLVLKYKQAGKLHGFGQKVGPMIRNTIGYKFDSMDVQGVLKAMDAPEFLANYQKTTDRWYADVKHDGTTGKSNTARHTEASQLSKDAQAFTALVKALRILCVRNQDWHEKGAHISLSMNGHRALLDFFGIQVTNSRRLKLVAN